MPTRADLYVGEGAESEWLGSVTFDGYPDGLDGRIYEASTESEYRNAVSLFLTGRDDSTLPEQGWPWVWKDSGTTDWAYTWQDGRVWASNFGDAWFAIQPQEPGFGDPEDSEFDGNPIWRGLPDFPDMTDRKNVRHDAGSGFITFYIPGPRTSSITKD